MRNLLTLILLGCSIDSIPAQTPAGEYTFPDGRFKCRLESKPQLDTKAIRIRSGIMNITTVSSSRSSDLILSISYADLPQFTVDTDTEKLFSSTIQAMAKNGTLVEERSLEAKNTTPAGKEVQLQHGKIQTRARLYLDGQRLYIISAVGSSTKVQDKAAEALLQHFVIVP